MGFGFGQITTCGLFECRFDVVAGEPVFAVEPAVRVAHRRQRIVVGRAFGPCGIGIDRRIGKVGHADSFIVEEIVQFDIMAVFCTTTYPLAIADKQVTQLAAGVQFIEHTVGKVGPRNELKAHGVAGLRFEFFGQFDQRVRRVPSGPAQGKILGLSAGRKGSGNKADGTDRCHFKILHLFSSQGETGTSFVGRRIVGLTS